MLLALLPVVLAVEPALPPWRTYSWVGAPTAPYDWYRDRAGCVVGFPTEGGASVRRCGSPSFAGLEVLDHASRRPPTRDEPGLVPLGRWAEVPVEELVVVPSGPPYDGQRVTVHVALKETPEITSFERHPCHRDDCAGPGDWPVDARVPADLDGTSIVRGHAVGDRRYAEAWADWSAAALTAAAARARGAEPPPATGPGPSGLPDTRFALILPVGISGKEGWPPLKVWKVEAPVDALRGGMRTRRSFPELGVALEVTLGERYVRVRPQDLEVECPDPLAWTTRPEWLPEPPPCNQAVWDASLRVAPLQVEGERAALGGRAARVDPFPFDESELWMTLGLGREPMNLYAYAPYPADLAYAGRDPLLVFAPPPPAPPPASPSRSGHVPEPPPPVLHFPSAATVQPDGRIAVGPRDWPVATWYPSDAGTRLDLALVAGASPPRGDAEPAVVLAADLDPGADVSGPWEVPGGLPPSARWLRLRWTLDGAPLMTETIALAPPHGGRDEPDTCTPAVSSGVVMAVRDAICPPLASGAVGER